MDVQRDGGLVAIIRLIKILLKELHSVTLPRFTGARVHSVRRVWVSISLENPHWDFPKTGVCFSR